ncbi:hypothetical protein Tco_0935529 [Tanacetum coccineum]
METYSCEFCRGIPHPGFDFQTGNMPVYDQGEISRQQSIAPVTPPPLAYIPPTFLSYHGTFRHLLNGDEVISTTPARENDEFIKSSVDDLFPVPRESEMTLVSTDLECSMPIDSPPLPCTDVLRDEKVDIDLPFGEHLDTLSTGDRETNFNPSDLETIDPVPDPRMFDVPLGNDDSISRSFDVIISNPLFDFDDYFTLRIDNKFFDDDFEDLCSLDPTKLTPIIDEATLLVTPLPDYKVIYLREVERFDPFFSLTQSGDMTWVMERPSYRFPHMSLPRQVAYSPKVVMYCYFHPNLILSDGCVLEPRNK